MKNLKASAFNAVKWNSFMQVFDLLQRFTLGVILARLLSPEDYGIVALVMVITEVLVIFVDSGFAVGLIQGKNVTKKDFSTVFYFNIGISFIISLLLFSSSSYLAGYYDNVKVEAICKFVSIIFFFQAFSITQRAYLTREINFKYQAIIDFLTGLTSQIIAIYLAYKGYSYWALLIKYAIAVTLQNIFYWFYSGWKPSLIFEFSRLKIIWKFSSKIFYSGLWSQIINRIDFFIIAKIFNPQILGYYSQGKNYAMLPATILTNISTNALFPVFSRIQDDFAKRENLYLKVKKIIIFLCTPMFSFLIIFANPIIYLVFGSKWLPMVPYFILFCLYGYIYVINALKVNFLNSIGHPQYILHYGFITGSLRIIILFGMAFFVKNIHPTAYVYTILFFMILSLFFFNYFILKAASIQFKKQITSIIPEVILNIPFIIILLAIRLVYKIDDIFVLLIISISFYTTYLFIGYLLKLNYLMEFKTQLLQKKNQTSN